MTVKIGSKEHYDILESFERNFSHMRLSKEQKSLWLIGQIYEDGTTNNAYQAYIKGYALGRAVYMHDES